MKSSLIIKLVEAHCTGNEDAFRAALQNVATDEERKGNIALSSSLMKAYIPDKKPNISLSSSPLSKMSFSIQSAIPTPKDKNSALELIEVLQPSVKFKDIALPEKTKAALLQIIEEQKKLNIYFQKGSLQQTGFCFVDLQDVAKH